MSRDVVRVTDPLSMFLRRLFHAGWRGVQVYEDVHRQPERVDLVDGDDVVDSYSAAQLDAGQTLGLYEQLHAQAFKRGLIVTLTSNPGRHPDFAHTVTVSRGRVRTQGEGPDPLMALLRALLDYQRVTLPARNFSRTAQRLADRFRPGR